MTTDTLIERLAHGLAPVQRLQRPAIRTLSWGFGAMTVLALVAAPLTSKADLAANGTGLAFVGPQIVAIVAGLVAAAAAFASVIPGYSRRILAWPVVAAVAWVVSLVAGAHGQWAPMAIARPAQNEWLCVAMIAITGAPLLFVLARMLRQGAPLNPFITAALAAFAVGTLANIGACISHPHTSGAVTLVWHGATLAAWVIASAAGGRFVLTWRNRAIT